MILKQRVKLKDLKKYSHVTTISIITFSFLNLKKQNASKHLIRGLKDLKSGDYMEYDEFLEELKKMDEDDENDENDENE